MQGCLPAWPRLPVLGASCDELSGLLCGCCVLQLNDVLGPDTMTFLAWDFFLHDSQATPLVAGSSPVYSTTVQYIVEADVFLLEYLMKQQLALELFEARGWDAAAIGLAHVPLKLLLQDLEVGAGTSCCWPRTALEQVLLCTMALHDPRLVNYSCR
jgi:hypothetical protein